MKKIFYIIIPVLIAIGAIVGIVVIGNDNAIDEEIIIGGDRDEHACLISAGDQWCEARQKCMRFWEEKCDDDQMIDEVNNFIEKLEGELGIEFSESQDSQIEWFYSQADEVLSTDVNALKYQIQNVSEVDYQILKTYLLDNNFESDVCNMSSGAVAGKEGFQRAITICDLEYQQETQSDDKALDIVLSCGLLDEIDLAVETIGYQMRKLISKELNIPVTKLGVEIEYEAEMHVRGVLTINDLSDERSGIFFAHGIPNHWQLIFVGDSPFDCMVMHDYGYSNEMLEGCIGK